ncbi:hypothetical protein C0992_004862 [Termitomyces sp. T32_za158]|nr:hypothetical protein C0992_004862 [Termitomyces sp. T32_za158]
MPVTRTSRQHASEDNNLLLAPSPQPTTRPSSKHKRVPAPKSKPAILAEVIEISSDDDEPPPRAHSVAADLRLQVKKLREVCCTLIGRSEFSDRLRNKENTRLKAELKTSGGELCGAKKEIVELKAASRPGKLVRL